MQFFICVKLNFRMKQYNTQLYDVCQCSSFGIYCFSLVLQHIKKLQPNFTHSNIYFLLPFMQYLFMCPLGSSTECKSRSVHSINCLSIEYHWCEWCCSIRMSFMTPIQLLFVVNILGFPLKCFQNYRASFYQMFKELKAKKNWKVVGCLWNTNSLQ